MNSTAPTTVMEAPTQAPTHCLADHPCAVLCPECKEAAHRAINAAFCAAHPFDCQREPGRGLRFVDRDSAEGLAILAQRAARREREGLGVDSLLVAALGGGR